MFRNKEIVRYLSLLLLFAMMAAVVPYHQIFHQHTTKTSTHHHEQTNINAYEKTCCKPANVFHKSQALITASGFTFLKTFNTYKNSNYNNPQFQLIPSFSNKAPPVLIV